MRTIKFSAKTANPNGIKNHISYWVSGLLEKGCKDYPYVIDGCFVEPETISEFTGINDINNIELFENDLVKFMKEIYIIIFNDGAFCLNNDFLAEIISMYDYRGNDYQKVGNIFDNPELLPRL